MTAEEIKSAVTMTEVLERYGVKVGRNGMACCPIHGEKHPSMKVFPDGYKCFACGANGDVFRFIQEMEGCDFKTAFKALGGTYQAHSTSMTRANSRKHYERLRAKKQKAEEHEREFRHILDGTIQLCQSMISFSEPLSDDWCDATNCLQWLWHVYEVKYLEGEEVDEVDVLRTYRKIRQRYVAVGGSAE